MSSISSKPTKRPVGVRLNPDEKAFLATLTKDGSVTEGLRLLVSRARAAAAAPTTIEEAQNRINTAIGDVAATFRHPPRSVVAEDLLREASLLIATVMVGPPAPGIEDTTARSAYEASIVDRGFDLADTLFRHALAAQAAAWSPGVVRRRLQSSRELLVGSLAAVAKDTPPSSSPRS